MIFIFKTHKSVCAGLLLAAMFAFQGCKMPEVEWGWRAERPENIREVFSHDVHEAVLEKEGFACSVCHPMDILLEEEKEEEEMYAVSREVFFPGKETCHFCHFNPKGVRAAPGRCGMCHFDLLEIQPDNHRFDWRSKHGVYAQADGEGCGSCHAPNFCEDCHQRRDLPTQRVHDRNFRSVHGLEARVNPRSCGACHEGTSFCEGCHIGGGYER